MEHNFKALQTFRGWSEKREEWIHGYLVDTVEFFTKTLHGGPYITFNGKWVKVNKNSIGIYTGKDDSEGTPIFAGLPEFEAELKQKDKK